MNKIYPAKLKIVDTVAVIAPSLSCSIVSAEKMETAQKCFAALGLRVVFGQHGSSSKRTPKYFVGFPILPR